MAFTLGSRSPTRRFAPAGSAAAVALLAAALLAAANPARAVDVYLDINSREARRIDIAVPLFATSDESPDSLKLAPEFRDILLRDLKDAGIFNVVDISAFYRGEGADRGDIDFKQWYLVGLQALVAGNFSVSGPDLTVRAWLYDIPMGQLITGRAYTAPVDQYRQVLHRLADEIIYRFTGERGVAESRIFAVVIKDRVKQICTMDGDGHGLRVLTTGDYIKLFPSPSPLGSGTPGGDRLLLTAYRRANPDLYSLDLATGQLQPLLEGGLNSNPAWSPDASKIALTRSVDGNPEIFAADPGGGNLRQMTFARGVDSSPCWSSTGREIVFTSDRSGTPQLWIMDAEGSNQRRLTYVGAYNDSPNWSPRGDRIVFQSRLDGRFEIATIRPDGNGFMVLTSGAGDNESPCFSPDGRRIVFSSNREGISQLYAIPAEGGVARRLTDGKDPYTAPRWVR